MKEEIPKGRSFRRKYLDLRMTPVEQKNRSSRIDRNVPVVLCAQRGKIQKRMPLLVEFLHLSWRAIIRDENIPHCITRNRLRILELSRLASSFTPLRNQLQRRRRRSLRGVGSAAAGTNNADYRRDYCGKKKTLSQTIRKKYAAKLPPITYGSSLQKDSQRAGSCVVLYPQRHRSAKPL